MKYAERTLSDVAVWGFAVGFHADTTAVTGSVRLQVTNQDGGDHGPDVTIQISTAVDERNPTIRDAEHALLMSAYELIKRLATETPETLIEKLESLRPQDNFFAEKP
ncbi:hypothetical protein RWA06_01955 [Sinorhizobium meliloti]|uniref:hypothetical protein n=1 Tax=Rhizobium meliloti TaxID=382 RepID=UPI00299EE2FF|nr:hypothetical protein [Sinorhizobium meliloti]